MTLDNRTLFDMDINKVLEDFKPQGTQFIVYIHDDMLPVAYGPWDSFGEAAAWAADNSGIVLPLYPR